LSAHVAAPEIPGARDLIALASESRGTPRERFAIARAAGHALAALHRSGIALADCHVKNLLVERREGLPPKLWLIDLDGSRVVSGNLAERRAIADICRLWKSAEKHGAVRELLTRAQQLRFLRAYWGESAGGLTLRKSAAFLKLLSWHRRRYARAAYAE
jgi:tRNA A-37 threonylcarbamoyl transferase component Bud32